MTEKTFQGTLSISKNLSYNDPLPISITLEDSTSRTQCLVLHMSLEAFAKALFGQSQPCNFQVRTRLVGKYHQTKTELIPVPSIPDRERQKIVAQEAVSRHEVDGWKGDLDDALNRNRINGKRDNVPLYEVRYTRWVDGNDNPVEPVA